MSSKAPVLQLHRLGNRLLKLRVVGNDAGSQRFEDGVHEGRVRKQRRETVGVEVANRDVLASPARQGWGGGSLQEIRKPGGVCRSDECEHRAVTAPLCLEDVVRHASFPQAVGIGGGLVCAESARGLQVFGWAERPQAPRVQDVVCVSVVVGQVRIDEKGLAGVLFGPPQAFDQRVPGGDHPDEGVLSLLFAEYDGDLRQAADAPAGDLVEGRRKLDRHSRRLQFLEHATHE